MHTRRRISTTSLSGSIQWNMCYISDLRRRIRKLEEEAAEISQRLNMLLADLDVNRTENNALWPFEQEVEQHFKLQDALNLSLQEEIKHLRRPTGMEPRRVSFNVVQSEPSASQSAHAADDHHDKPEPKEPKGK